MRVIVPIVVVMMFAVFPAHATITYQGNGITDTTTFAGNNVLVHVVDSNDVSSSFFVGRTSPSLVPGGQEGLGDYAVSVAREGVDTIQPYAPPTVRLNGVADQPNPVWGQKIALLGLYTGAFSAFNPCMVTTAAPQNIYWNVSNQGADPFDIYSVTNLLDANGATTSGVVALTGANFRESTSASQISGSLIMAIVGPNGGVFGAPGSGIAMLGQGQSSLVQYAAVGGNPNAQAVPLDGTQAYVKIGANGTINNAPSPDVYFNPITQRVYGAFSASCAGVAASGVRGVVSGYLNPVRNGDSIQYTFVPIDFAPATAYVGLGQTAVAGLVTGGAVLTSTWTKFRSLWTSTGLTYGVLVGSNNTVGFNASKMVSAVPLVNKSVDPSNTSWPTDPTQGAMASKLVNPGTNLQTFFNPLFYVYPYMGRGFQTPATVPGDMPLLGEAPVWVGGAEAPGVIFDIQAFKDTVFVAVDSSGPGGQAPGVFGSQALFDANAAIKGWTPWQRVATPTQQGNTIYGIGYQPTVGKMFTMEGASQTTIDTVLTTTWNLPLGDGLLGGPINAPQNGFATLVDNQFSQGAGGIQGIFDFPAKTPELSQVLGNRCSYMIFTGYRRMVMVQTSSDVAHVLTPTVGDFSTNMEVSNNGSVTTPGAGALILSVGGGAIDTIGAITSAALVTDGAAFNYLVVGGVGGIAVLQPGWPLAGLHSHFENLPASAFTLLGSYKNVRKLLSDGTNLYVLTNQTFDRIPVTQLAGTTITPVTLATPTAMGLAKYGQFSDAAVSAKVALLATSQGLFTTGAGSDVSTATNTAAVGWTLVTLPESPLAVSRLQVISPTGLQDGFSKNDLNGNPTGGTVYVLAGSVTYDLTSIYRLAVQSTQVAAVTNNTVQVIPDYYIKSTTSALTALGAYRNYSTNLGALITASESSPDGAQPIFEILPPSVRTGSLFKPGFKQVLSGTVANSFAIGTMLRNSGVGALIFSTNIGMRVLE